MPTQVTPPTSLRPFFVAKRFGGTFVSGARTIDVELRTPDLTEAKTRLWGDWGPMFTCELQATQTVQVTYRCQQSGHAATFALSPQHVEVNSPLRGAERDVSPFYIEIVDCDRGVQLQGFMNGDGEVRQAKIAPVSPTLNVYAMIFGNDAAEVLEDATGEGGKSVNNHMA